ncbi:MAG TPA: type II toxin-antitoxin system VapC family toxin [Longimicrobium sp.]|nr:type II toxin-antitoxin system VapC family toxin [Longimicrobium sp.]
MRALLDTHAFLWFISGDRRLSDVARNRIEAHDSEVLLSIASIWEIAVKAGLGKLPLPSPVRSFVPQQMLENRIGLLPVALDHALEVASLPHHHRDPFDRMLVVQARMEEMPIISADPALDRYGVDRVW